MAKLGPTQDAIRMMALHLPKTPPAMTPAPWPRCVTRSEPTISPALS